MSRYIVFDVETPNSQNNRISSIGTIFISLLTIFRNHQSPNKPHK